MAGELNIKDVTQDKSPNDKLAEFMREVRSKARIDYADTVNWRNKMIIANNQRLGVKRYSNSPYPGAPDIPLPETDKLIKKSLPNLVLSAWSPKNPVVVQVKQGFEDKPEWKEKAKKCTKAMNMLIRSKELNWFSKLMLAADNLKQYGHCIFRVFEEYKSRWISETVDLEDYDSEVVKQLKGLNKQELAVFIADRYNFDLEDDEEKAIVDDIVDQFKSGETIIEFSYEQVNPIAQIEIVNPTKLTVPTYTTDINNAVRLREVFFLPEYEIERLMEKGIFIKHDLKDVPKFAGQTEDLIEYQKSRNEGITDNTSGTDLYRLETIRCWFKEKNNEPAHKRVMTFFCDVSDEESALLQNIAFPYKFEGWDYEKHDNEIKDTRYYNSRGVPEQIRALHEVMERSINNMLIRDEMLNTPIWEVLDTSQLMSSHIRMTPGQKLPVKQLGTEVKQLNEFPRSDTSSNQILSLVKAYTEEYQSANDMYFSSAANPAAGQRRVTELQMAVTNNQGPLSLEITSWNETLSRVYQKMFDVLQERVGDSIWVDGEEITREDFNFPAEVRSNGNLEVANEQLAVQKAFARLGFLINPVLADVVNSEDKYNAVKDWLEKDGVKDPDMFCTDPKKIAQEQIAQMQGQLQQMQQQGAMMQKEGAETKFAADKEKKRLQDNTQLADKLEESNSFDIGKDIGEGMADELSTAGAGRAA